MFRWIVLVGCLMGVIVGLIIGVMNPQPVDVFLPGVQFTLGLGGVMTLVFAAGVTVGLLLFLLLFHLPWRVNRRGKAMASKGTGLSDRNA
jgi:uncharacterized membrane protein YciS (DUF1049 family)